VLARDDGIECQKAGIVHAGNACQCRHDRAEEGDEAVQENGRTAASAQEVLCLVQLVPVAVQRPDFQQFRPHVFSNFIPDAVSDDCGQNHQGHHQPQPYLATAGNHSIENRSRFARNDEPDKKSVLGEHEQGNQGISKQGLTPMMPSMSRLRELPPLLLFRLRPQTLEGP